jgi:hypothetical protein
MKMGLRYLLVAAVLCVATVGCGGVRDEKVMVASSAIENSIRKVLEEYEKSGKTSSAMTSLESDINGVKSSDSAKAAALMEGYRALQVAATPDEVKSAARSMLGKL